VKKLLEISGALTAFSDAKSAAQAAAKSK